MAVHHLALRSPDPESLAAYYRRVLDLPELRRGSDRAGLYSVWLDLGGATLMIERGASPPASPAADAGWDGMFLVAPPGSDKGFYRVLLVE